MHLCSSETSGGAPSWGFNLSEAMCPFCGVLPGQGVHARSRVAWPIIGALGLSTERMGCSAELRSLGTGSRRQEHLFHAPPYTVHPGGPAASSRLCLGCA